MVEENAPLLFVGKREADEDSHNTGDNLEETKGEIKCRWRCLWNVDDSVELPKAADLLGDDVDVGMYECCLLYTSDAADD